MSNFVYEMFHINILRLLMLQKIHKSDAKEIKSHYERSEQKNESWIFVIGLSIIWGLIIY